MRSPTVRKAVRDGLIVAGLLFAVYLFVVVAPQTKTVGFDAFAYWSVDLRNPYRLSAGHLGAFNYTPVAAFGFAPAHMLAFWQFLWIWEALLLGTVVWLGRRRSLWLVAFPPVALELYHGNIHLLLAAAIVLGFRYPAAWAFVLLTKVTPGVGLIWFAVRREWHHLAVVVSVTAVLVVASGIASTLLGLDLWDSWLRSISATAGGTPLSQVAIDVPLAVRLPAAAILIAWGAATERRWTVPLAACLALPILWLTGFAMLAALASDQLQSDAPVSTRAPDGSRTPGTRSATA